MLNRTRPDQACVVKPTKDREEKLLSWAVVVAQLVERSLPSPEVRGYNPVITFEHLLSNILKRQK